jgi:hypothetical protein
MATMDPRLVLSGSWLRESGALAVRELFDVRGVPVEGVSAIACANDYMALGALDELRERGISVPGEIAVTGFDDVEALRSARPPLTTVAQPTEALGREGLKRLVTLMNRGEEPLHEPDGSDGRAPIVWLHEGRKPSSVAPLHCIATELRARHSRAPRADLRRAFAERAGRVVRRRQRLGGAALERANP